MYDVPAWYHDVEVKPLIELIDGKMLNNALVFAVISKQNSIQFVIISLSVLSLNQTLG